MPTKKIIPPEQVGLPTASAVKMTAKATPTPNVPRHLRPGPKHHAVAARFALLNGFVDQCMAAPGLRGAGIAVWLFLFRHAKADGKVEAGVERIAKATGLGERQVRRRIEALCRNGAVVRLQKGNRRRGVSRYCLVSIGSLSKPEII